RLRSRFSDRERSWIFCAAKCFHRTEMALWLPRYANKRAKIEERGVESSSVGFCKTRCIPPKRFPRRTGIDGFSKIEKPRQNASGVRFDNLGRLIECKAGYGVPGVFPDLGKLLQFVAWVP